MISPQLSIGAIVFGLSLSTTSAHAHDWFKLKSDPVTGARCCNNNEPPSQTYDCREVPQTMVDEGAISPVKGGYWVVLTAEQVHYFNLVQNGGMKRFIPSARVMPSEAHEQGTSGYALCIFLNDIGCFFAPTIS